MKIINDAYKDKDHIEKTICILLVVAILVLKKQNLWILSRPLHFFKTILEDVAYMARTIGLKNKAAAYAHNVQVFTARVGLGIITSAQYQIQHFSFGGGRINYQLLYLNFINIFSIQQRLGRRNM